MQEVAKDFPGEVFGKFPNSIDQLSSASVAAAVVASRSANGALCFVDQVD